VIVLILEFDDGTDGQKNRFTSYFIARPHSEALYESPTDFLET